MRRRANKNHNFDARVLTEIRGRYEIIREPLKTKDDCESVAEWRIAETIEVAENCTEDKSSQHEAVFQHQARPHPDSKTRPSVTEDEVSVGHVEELRRQMELPESCTVLSSAVTAAVAKILRRPTHQIGVLTEKAQRIKLVKELARALERLSNTTDEEYADQVISRMVAFAEASEEGVLASNYRARKEQQVNS